MANETDTTEHTEDDTLDLDEVKGRAKRAAGELTDDEELRRDGKIDRVVSDVKDRVDDVADKVKNLLNSDKGDKASNKS